MRRMLLLSLLALSGSAAAEPLIVDHGRLFITASVDTTSSRADLNVGTPILKDFVVTADFKGRAAWFEPVGDVQSSQ